ncbi:MAG: hypothetical protein ACHQ7M_01285 [Chloroflexota bacterium]
MVEYAKRQRKAAWVLVVGGVLMGIMLQLAGRIHLAPLLLGAVCLVAHLVQRPDDRYLEPGGLLFGFGLGTFVFHEGWLTGLVGEGAEIAGLGIGMLIVHWLQLRPSWSAFGGFALLYIGLNAMLLGSGALPAGVNAVLFGTGALWALVPIGMGAFLLCQRSAEYT